MPAFPVLSLPTNHQPESERRGDERDVGTLGLWLLGASVVVATVFAFVDNTSHRTTDIAAIVAALSITVCLVPWLWVGWMERRLRWISTFRLTTIALGVLAAAQIATAVFAIEDDRPSLDPIWIDLLRLTGLTLAVAVTLRSVLPITRRRSAIRLLRIPSVVTTAVTFLILVATRTASDGDVTESLATWLLAGLLIAGPAMIASVHASSRIGSVVPHRLLAIGWAAIAVVATGSALDRLLQDQEVSPRTNWAMLPGLAFLTAAAIELLGNRRPARLTHAGNTVSSPPTTWLRALAPSLVAAAATTIAVIQLADSRELRSAFIAAAALSVALGIVIQQTVAHVRLSRAATRLEQTRRELALQATVDPVSGLPNRRAVDARLAEEVERAIRYQQPLSLCFIDIDHFKTINDTLGHATGDVVLREVGSILRRTARAIDFVGRYGGEEFVILLPGTWSGDALTLGDRLRRSASHHAFNANGVQPVRLTISVGIAGLPEHAQSGDDLRNRADAAVYRAKAAGRDRVVLFEPLPDDTRKDESQSAQST